MAFPGPDETERPTSPGIDAAPPVEGDPPPGWQQHHTPSAALAGVPMLPSWLATLIYYKYISFPAIILACGGLCTGAFVSVWWLAKRVINAWIVS